MGDSLNFAVDIATLAVGLVIFVYLIAGLVAQVFYLKSQKRLAEKNRKEEKEFEDDLIRMYGCDPELDSE